jgi:hypothetical protein
MTSDSLKHRGGSFEALVFVPAFPAEDSISSVWYFA